MDDKQIEIACPCCKSRLLVDVRTGKLLRSLRVSVRKSFGKVTAFVKAGNAEAWYAMFVEFGTKAHVIKPSNAKALEFGGTFAEEVRHPGAQRHPYMRPAFDRGWRKAVDAFAAYVRKRLGLAGGLDRQED